MAVDVQIEFPAERFLSFSDSVIAVNAKVGHRKLCRSFSTFDGIQHRQRVLMRSYVMNPQYIRARQQSGQVGSYCTSQPLVYRPVQEAANE